MTVPASEWREIRCANPTCRLARSKNGVPANPKLLGKFTAGSLSKFGRVEIVCPDCKTIATVTVLNQQGDGFGVFPVGQFLYRHRPKVKARLGATTS